MENKILSQDESLELITRMIQETRKGFEKGGGNIFLLWGYLCLGVSLLVYFLFHYTSNYSVLWLWFLIPVLGYPFMYLIKRRDRKRIVTFIDSVICKIWIVIGFCTLLICLTILYDYSLLPILFLISLLVTSGVAMSGLIMKFKPVIISGFIGIFICFCFLFVPWVYQTLVFSAMAIIMLIIPGHILNLSVKAEQHD